MYSLHINGWTPPALAVAIAIREKNADFAVVEHEWQASADALKPFADQLEPLEGRGIVMPDADHRAGHMLELVRLSPLHSPHLS